MVAFRLAWKSAHECTAFSSSLEQYWQTYLKQVRMLSLMRVLQSGWQASVRDQLAVYIMGQAVLPRHDITGLLPFASRC